MTQSITSRFVCARSVPVRRLSSKRARRRSSRRSRRAPSFEVCRDSPHPLVARAHASRHFVTQHAILSVIGREPDLRPSCSHVCNFNGTRQSIALVGSARRRARARACHWRFSAPSPRETSCHHTCAHALDTRQPRRRRRSRRIRNQDRDHNGHDQLSVLSLPNPFPKLTARARSQVRSRRDTVTDAAAAAQHGGGGGDRRSHGGAVARAMWQRRVTVRLQTITTARNDRAKARYFNSLLLGYAGGGGGERRWQGPRARAALWSAVAAVVLAAATCSPSGGGGSGGASYTRHRGRYVVRAVDLDPAVVRIFRPWALFFARARATGAPGLGAQAKTTWGRASGVK